VVITGCLIPAETCVALLITRRRRDRAAVTVAKLTDKARPACQPPNRAWLIDSRRRARALWTVPLTVPRAWHIGRKATVMRRIRTDR
jgi:hypothetical protein